MDTENPPFPAPLTDVVERTPSLQTAHILFMDIVGFGRLRTQQQVAAQVELSRLVQNTAEVRAARGQIGGFICRPTGDGMALLFFQDKLSPIRCALQIHGQLQADASQIRRNVGVPIRLRMGIHTGDVTLVSDINAQADAAGDGIIVAQRVMNAGDADHILLSADVARTLLKIDPWPRYLTDLGHLRVKHRQVVHLYNLYGRLDGPFCGNPARPQSLAEDAAARSREARTERGTLADRLRPYRATTTALLLLGSAGGGGFAYYRSNPTRVGGMWRTLQTRLLPTPTPGHSPASLRTPAPKGAHPKAKQAHRRAPARSAARRPAADRPVEKVPVPNLIQDTAEGAREHLEGDGLQMKERLPRVFKADFPEGTVYSQSPPPGASVPLNATVSVRVSAGPPSEETVEDESSRNSESSETASDESSL